MSKNILLSIGITACSLLLVTGCKVTNKDLDPVASYSQISEQAESFIHTPIILQIGSSEIHTTPFDLGVSINRFRTLEHAYESDVVDPLAIEPIIEVQEEKFINALQQSGEIVATEHLDEIIERFKDELSDYQLPDRFYISVPAPTHQEKRQGRLRDRLLRQVVVFEYAPNTADQYRHEIPLQGDWFTVTGESVQYLPERIESYVERIIAPEVSRDMQSATIVSRSEDSNQSYVIDGLAQYGIRVRSDDTTESFLRLAVNGTFHIPISVDQIAPTIIDTTQDPPVTLVLLGQGRSNFAGSPEGRDYNVRKGLRDVINNKIIPPNESFSFNASLGPVTKKAGWKDALTVFGGGGISLAPGGGLCQVSTTLYRAALHAGLPIVQKSNHSIYISYYKAYGDGLDAAIYPNVKDLRFRNDTKGLMLIQAYTDGNDAIVNLYGMHDGRAVKLSGPMYRTKVLPEYKDVVKPKSNQIVWMHTLTPFGETPRESTIISSYNKALW